ncbi:hypothetical protein AX16_007764 [Volvariella volvacea WC 439]|nr:hypothetical protein AX16_007764 [Volvariella volvacea WC 439]
MFNPAAKYLPSLLFYSLILATATPVLCAAPNIAFEARVPNLVRYLDSSLADSSPRAGPSNINATKAAATERSIVVQIALVAGFPFQEHSLVLTIRTTAVHYDIANPNPNHNFYNKQPTDDLRRKSPNTSPWIHIQIPAEGPLAGGKPKWKGMLSGTPLKAGSCTSKATFYMLILVLVGRAIYLYASSYNAHWSVFYGEVRTTFGDANASVVGVAKNCTITWAAEGLDATVMTTITIEVYGPQIQSGVDDFMFEFNNLQVAVQEATMGPVSTTAGPTRSSPAAGVPTSPFASRAECIRCQNIAWALFVAAVALVVIS